VYYSSRDFETLVVAMNSCEVKCEYMTLYRQGSGSARQPDPAGQDDDGAPPRPAPAPCAAWRGPGMVWTVGVGSGVPLRGRVPAL
jgi:hypothetical protein